MIRISYTMILHCQTSATSKIESFTTHFHPPGSVYLILPWRLVNQIRGSFQDIHKAQDFIDAKIAAKPWLEEWERKVRRV